MTFSEINQKVRSGNNQKGRGTERIISVPLPDVKYNNKILN